MWDIAVRVRVFFVYYRQLVLVHLLWLKSKKIILGVIMEITFATQFHRSVHAKMGSPLPVHSPLSKCVCVAERQQKT